jgi:short-subunit dehydrogenase
MAVQLDGQVVFITGASAGIGAALARQAAARGARVALCARREDRLQALADELRAAGCQAEAIQCDVTRAGDLEQAATRTCQQLGGIDIAIANAGFGVTGPLTQLSLDDYRRQFETNVFGVLRTIYAVLPELRARRGRLAVMGSTNGYVSVPGSSAYCMSKAAVRSLCAALRHELAPDGVSVTHLAPGFVRSEFRQIDNTGRLRAQYDDPVPSWLVMSSAKAAAQMLRGIVHRRAEVVITVHGRAAVGLERHVPWVVSRVLGKTGRLAKAWTKRH